MWCCVAVLRRWCIVGLCGFDCGVMLWLCVLVVVVMWLCVVT